MGEHFKVNALKGQVEGAEILRYTLHRFHDNHNNK
jgi:hypothetical protein